MTLSASKSVVRLGDASSHGGKVTSASGHCNVGGVAAAVTGDLHSCPLPGHGVTSLTAASSNKTGGKSIVLVGDTAGCGAVMTTGSMNVLSR